MRLAELREQLVIYERWPWPWSRRIAIGTKPHRRASWKRKAMVAMLADGSMRISGPYCCVPYAYSFEDLMADDWEICEEEADG